MGSDIQAHSSSKSTSSSAGAFQAATALAGKSGSKLNIQIGQAKKHLQQVFGNPLWQDMCKEASFTKHIHALSLMSMEAGQEGAGNAERVATFWVSGLTAGKHFARQMRVHSKHKKHEHLIAAMVPCLNFSEFPQ